MRRVAPAIGLFLLAPFVGEFLLGNQTLVDLGAAPLLAPLYGAGALLIREVARRNGRGWPTIVLLAVAYALLEEGPVDQLLWNDSYAGEDLLHGDSYIPAIGMSVELTQAVIALHTVWSMCVPIAIMETLVAPSRRTTPWLRKPGLIAIGIVFALLGIVGLFFANYSEEHFIASPAQIGGVVLVIVALVVLAFRQKPSARLRAGNAPSPASVGVFGLIATSAYWAPAVLVTAGWYEWIGVVAWCAVAAVAVVLVSRWSRQDGWDQRHAFALAAGAMLTYVWVAFPLRPEGGGSRSVDLLSNAVFGAIAVVILLVAVRRVNPNQR